MLRCDPKHFSDDLTTTPENDVSTAAWYLAMQHSAPVPDSAERTGTRDPAINAVVSRFEKRLKIDRELQAKIKAVRALLKR